MKKFLLLSVAVTLTCTMSFAKIWRVNNNSGVTADFTALQAAHDGASSGDTIYLESSPTSYGGLNCTKKLAIIGTGYFLDQNTDLQAFTLPSHVSGISFNAGSQGSSVEGLSFDGNGISIYSVNDIVVRRNNFGGINGSTPDYYVGVINIYNGASNILITQNYAVQVYSNSSSTGVLISNNFISYQSYYGDNTANAAINLHANTVAIIKNNIFRRGAISAYNSNISNNIMIVGSLAGSGNLISNNIGSSTQFGNTNGNKQNVDAGTIFEGTGSYDGAYKLKSGSPAIGAGYGSTSASPVDCGIFGGTTPYKLSGLPAIPSIYFFSNQPVGSNSDPIDVQVKVRSNN
jgi:hypothetical protein